MTVDAATALPGCLQVTHQLFYFLDESRYEDLVALFTPDGTLHRQGELLVGPEAIMQAMSKRSVTQRIRHVISNGFIESQSADQVHLVAYMVAYRFDDGTLHTEPVDISRPLRLSVVRATLRQTEASWKIQAMTFTAQFEFVGDAVASEVRP